MTNLLKPVTRKTQRAVSPSGKPFVVSIEPGDVIALKEFGSRTWFRIPIAHLYNQLVRQSAGLP